MTGERDKVNTLIIECGVAQTRAALIENNDVAQIWFGPAMGDEGTDHTPQAGQQYFGRVTSINASLNAAFIDLGEGGEGYLALNKKLATTVSEGTVIRVDIKSPPRQGKASVVKFVSADGSKDTIIGRCSPIESATIEAMTVLGATADAVLINDGRAVATLREAYPDIEINHYTDAVAMFESFGVESVIEEIFQRSVDLAGGGRLIIDEAQALTAIDVDTGGLSAPSSERLREKIAMAAAQKSVRQIRLRNLAGHVVIDFPKLKSDTSRKRFTDFLRKTMGQIDGASAFSFSKSGLFSMVVPHRHQSLIEQSTEVNALNPIPGRCFTTAWQAKSAITKLEHRLHASPTCRLQLLLGEPLFDYIDSKDQWLHRLKERYSSRFELVLDENRMGSHFEIAEQ